MKIDPTVFENQDIPLWAVLDEVRIECVMVNRCGSDLVVWGYSVWRRAPGFRTLGISLDSYRARASSVDFYADQEHALDAMRLATTPAKKLAKTMLDDKQREVRCREAYARNDI